MTRPLLLFFVLLLSGCTKLDAKPSEALYQVHAWPNPVNIEQQSGVAKYITRGKAAYDSCVVNVEELRNMTHPDHEK